MQTQTLGQNGPRITRIGLGCMGMSEFYGDSDEAQSIATIQRALDLGINFFDTADMYGRGHNETLLGRALEGRREQAVVATKFGVLRGADGSFNGVSGRPEYVTKACEDSLRRLRIDAIDLYYQHRVDPEVPIEETVGAMARLVEQGKVRALGLSEAATETIRRAASVHPIAALQTELSLWSREPEAELLPLCQSLGITFVAYSPIGRGFLSGELRSPDDLAKNDVRRFLPRFSAENFPKNLAIVSCAEAIAAARACTPAQVALAWVLSRQNTVAIPGTRRVQRLEENAAAAQITLTRTELSALERAIPAAGTRYPADRMSSVNR